MNKRFRVTVVAFLQLFALALAQDRSTNSAALNIANTSIYITHVTVIDTKSGKEDRDRTVIISGNRILDIKDASEGTVGRKGSGCHGQVFDSGTVGHARSHSRVNQGFYAQPRGRE